MWKQMMASFKQRYIIATFFSRSKYFSYLNLPVPSWHLLKEIKRIELNLYKVDYNLEF